MFDVVVDTTSVRTLLTREVRVSAEDSEQLLVAWLSELNFLHQTRGELYADFEVTHSGGGRVVGRAMGEKLDPARHRLRTEIKGITYHGLRVTKGEHGWEGTVIFDV